MRDIEFLPLAEEEMNEAARFYEERSPGLGMSSWTRSNTLSTRSSLIPTPVDDFPKIFGVELSHDFPLVCFIRSSPTESSLLL
jgi:hypothetical protein